MILDANGNDMRADGWLNLTTGVGVEGSSKALDFVPDARLPDAFLEQLYIGEAYASRICRVVPEEATRQGFRVKLGEAGAEGALHAGLKRLRAVERLRAAWTWARVFGGGAVFVGADDGRDPAEPLDRTAIRSVRFLITLDRRELMPQRWYGDPLTPKYGQVELYLLQREGHGSVERAMVHESRLIRFDGMLSTRARRMFLQGWGESELQRIYSVLSKFNGGWEAVGTLLQEGSVNVITMKGLTAMMAADKQDLVKKRFAAMNAARSVTGTTLLDEGDTLTRNEVGALTGIADVLDKFLLLLSGAAEITVTILMGQSPAGLSATGESDVRWFYDRIKSAQIEVLAPAIECLVELLCLSQDGPTRGQLPAERSVEFAPLWQPTPQERAQERLTIAQADQIYITTQVVTPEEVATSRFRPDGYNAETTIDLAVRRAALEADATADAEVNTSAADHAKEIADVLERAAARTISRDSGVATLQSLFGMTPEAAEATMGENGRTHFTAPEPGHAAEMDALKGELAGAQASQRSTAQMLTRVLERNRAGELVVGSPIAKAPTELVEGEELEAGDVVEVPVEDSRFEVRRTDGRSSGVAVVLQLPPEFARGLPTQISAPDLHVTLAYLGMNDRWGPSSIDRVVGAVRQWALTVAPIVGTLGGIGRFAPGPDGEPVYVPVDSEAITDARPALVAFLRAAGFGVARGHGFTPHLTLGYLAAGEPTPPPVPTVRVAFPVVSVWWDAVRVDIELGGI